METWLASAAIVVIAVVIGIAGANAFVHMRWRRQRLAADIERYTALAATISRRDEAAHRRFSQRGSWSGFRKFRVTRKESEANNIASFYLRPHDGRPVAPFLPGQFLTFRFHDEEDREPTIRCYSLSHAHAEGKDYRVTIKHLRPPPEAPPETPWGKASSYFHNRVETDSVLEVAPPSGQFTLELAAGRPVVFIAGGIGITPFLAMMQQLAEQEPDREAWLFYGVRTRDERVMTTQLSQWAKRPNVHVVTCYSHLSESGEPLEEFEEEGFITTDVLGRWLPSSNYEFYVCGPPPMMTMVIDGLLDWEVPRSSIHTEAFTPETVREIAATASTAEATSPREVSFRSTGKKLQWTGDVGTILELAEQNGLFLPSGCRAGNCGTCATPVLAGSFIYLSKPEAPVEEGSCLVCVSVPTEDIEFA